MGRQISLAVCSLEFSSIIQMGRVAWVSPPENKWQQSLIPSKAKYHVFRNNKKLLNCSKIIWQGNPLCLLNLCRDNTTGLTWPREMQGDLQLSSAQQWKIQIDSCFQIQDSEHMHVSPRVALVWKSKHQRFWTEAAKCNEASTVWRLPTEPKRSSGQKRYLAMKWGLQ